MRTLSSLLIAPLIALAGIAFAAGSAGASTAVKHPQISFASASVSPGAAVHTVTTKFSAVPDSGYAGNNWGYDFYTQTFTWTRVHPVLKTRCGAKAKACYDFNWSLKLTGYTQTIENVMSPGEPFTPLDVVENANLTGSMSGSYLTSYRSVYTKYVPTSYDANGVNPTGNYQPQLWFALAQPGSYEVNTHAADYLWTFNYTVPKGADTQCPAYAGKWTDAYNVSEANSGNILAPNQADCASQS